MPNENNLPDDDITLKDVILIIQEYALLFWRKKFWIAIFVIIVAAYFCSKAIFAVDIYAAETTFMLNEEKSSSMPGFGAILGQFGLGGSVNENVNLKKIRELSRSRKIVQQVLFERAVIDGEDNYLANHVIDAYEYHEKWKDSEEPELIDFYFSDDSIPAFTRTQNDVLKTLYYNIIGNPDEGISGLLGVDYDEGTGILYLNGRSVREDLSIALSRTMYDKLSSFYIQKSTERQESTFKKISIKVDSVYKELKSVEYKLANYRNRSQNTIGTISKVYESDLMRQQQILSLMYAEALKNRETSSFLLNNSTPYFQTIDEPLPPLYPVKNSKAKALAKGGVIGFILGAILFAAIHLYGVIMKED